MGKKSKRHGKRSQQKKAGVKEEAASISSPEYGKILQDQQLPIRFCTHTSCPHAKHVT